MGMRHSRVFKSNKHKAHYDVVKEKELMFIKDHPDRYRRRSSVTPDVSTIKEERILEDLCDTTNIEPDVPGNNMGKREVHKLIRKISVSEKFTNKFPSEEDFLKHVRKLSDPTSNTLHTTTASDTRRNRLDEKRTTV